MNIGRGIGIVFTSVMLISVIISGVFAYLYGDSETFKHSFLNIYTLAILIICISLLIMLIKRPFAGLIVCAIICSSVAKTVLEDAVSRNNTSFYIQFVVIIIGVIFMISSAVQAYRYKRMK